MRAPIRPAPTRFAGLILAAALGIVSPATPAAPAPEPPTPAQRLRSFFAREWDRTLEEHPTWASRLGDRRWNDRWDDVAPDAFQRRHELDQRALVDLLGIDPAALTPRQRLDRDLFRRELRDRVEGFRHGWWMAPLDQRGGLQTEDDLGNSLRFDQEKDYRDWIARLRGFGGHVDRTILLMREGIRSGRVQPAVTMRRVTAQLDTQIVENPRESPFFKPLRRFPDSIPASTRESLAAETADAITSCLVPAFRRFRDFFATEYLPAGRKSAGIWSLPGGPESYAYLARHFTTTSLAPEEIHHIGLREVARIRALMEDARREAKFAGSLGEFFHFLRTDPQFFHATPLELLAAYQVVAKQIDPTLVRIFRTLPRTPYGVEPIPDLTAPDTTTAYYRPPSADGTRAGAYFVNLFRPETRPKWEMMALSLHEAVPGHHFQIALAQELDDVPEFRRHASLTAFVEGWGVYAESLGYDLGLYRTPYDRMGQLTYEMWRAVRLVVDTGVHALKWDRDRAIAYFRENAPKAENDIVNEIDRYLSWPGQALAYKIGELKLQELRQHARHELGGAFDLRSFHHAILAGGALPLDLLETEVHAWIARTKTKTESRRRSPDAAATTITNVRKDFPRQLTPITPRP